MKAENFQWKSLLDGNFPSDDVDSSNDFISLAFYSFEGTVFLLNAGKQWAQMAFGLGEASKHFARLLVEKKENVAPFEPLKFKALLKSTLTWLNPKLRHAIEL